MPARLHLALLIAFWVSPAATQDIDLINATVIDGSGGELRQRASIIVRAGKIREISSRSAPAAAGIRVVDVNGKYVLPGLIDAHTHLQTPSAALRALQSGVTTARVLGDSYSRALSMRELIRAGHVVGPELLVSSAIIRPRPGEAFFMTFPQFGAAINGELRGPEQIRKVVRAMLDLGVDVIKVSASERAGSATADPRRAELTEAEMAAAVSEAAKSGVPVAVHAHSRAGAAAAVAAGVRSIEHGTYIDESTLLEMKRRGTFLVPTLAVMSPLSDPTGNSSDDAVLRIRTQQMMGPLRAATIKARELGITIAAATDGSYGDDGDTARIRLADELKIMHEACGFTPMRAIQAATVNAARVLGIEARTGRIQPGFEGDLIVVERNPLTDLSVLYEPLLVVSDGRVAFERE